MRRTIIALAALAALGGCVERAPELSPADRERLNEYVSTQRPSPQNALNVRFENGIELLGYDVEQGTAPQEPGRPAERFVQVTWHWHAEQRPDEAWRMFTHVAKANGENALNQDGTGLVRELYQPGRWAPNQYIRDVQRVIVPADWGSDQMIFYVGFWDPGSNLRLRILRGPNDGENRARGPSVEIASAPSAAAEPGRQAAPAAPEPPRVQPPPSLNAARASGRITIDGQLDEADWNGATRSASFVNTLNGTPAPFRANARMLWDDDNLYVAVEVNDDFVKNTLTGRDAHLWEQDAVELMVDPDGDGANYFEMQVAPTGQVFDTRYDTRRQPQPFGDLAWASRLRAQVHVEGTANDEAADTKYTAEIAIPWRAFQAGTTPADAPHAGDTWRMNLYVMDARPAGQAQRSAGWSPTHEGDFHVPARFGRVTFQPPPQAAAEAPAAPVLRPAQLQLSPEAAQALRNTLGRAQPPSPLERRLLQQAQPAQ